MKSNQFIKKVPSLYKILFFISISSILVLVYHHNYQLMNRDGIYYIRLAKYVYHGDWVTAFQQRDTPFIPMLIVFAYQLLGNWVLAGYLVSYLAFVLAIIPFYFLAQRIFDEQTAFVSSLFFSCSPIFCSAASSITRDSVFILFSMIFFLYSYLASQEKKAFYYWCIFLSLIAASLCRVEGVLIFLAYSLTLVWRGITGKNIKTKRFTWGGILVICVAGLLFNPYHTMVKIKRLDDITKTLRNPIQMYRSLPLHQVIKQLKQLEKKTVGGGYGGDCVETARNTILLIYLISILNTWQLSAFPTMFILGMIGIISYLRKNDRRGRVFLYWMVFLLVPPYLFLLKYNFTSRRYLMLADVILYFWAGVGFWTSWKWIKKKASLRESFCWLFLALIVSISCGKIIFRHVVDGKNLIQASHWMQQRNTKKRFFITNDSRFLFYAGLPGDTTEARKFVIRTKRTEDLLEAARKLDAHWIIVKNPTPFPLIGSPVKIFPGNKLNVYVYKLADQQSAKKYNNSER